MKIEPVQVEKSVEIKDYGETYAPEYLNSQN